MEFSTKLREANEARAIEWSNGGDDGYFYAVELFGEAGEALNVVKKLERERLGMVGSRASTDDLGDELADVVICIDLLALTYELPEVTVEPDDEAYVQLQAAVLLGQEVGRVMGWVEKLEVEAEYDGEYLSLDALYRALQCALYATIITANAYGIYLPEAVVSKFNSTSDKYGLKTRMNTWTTGAARIG